MNTIKVGLVDDHELFREGIKLLMSRIEETELVFDVGSGIAALEELKSTMPDVLLLDLDMPGKNGVDTFQEARELYPDLKVIILTMHSEERMISYLMEMGVNGYLMKDSNRETLRNAILNVYEKGMYYSEEVSKAMLEGLKRKTRLTPRVGQKIVLSAREQEVLELVAEGYSNKEIAEKLFISSRTVDGHRTNILQKFDVHNTAKLVMEAVRKGFLAG
ncbi:response regulator [Roseivirga pacifica]|uniref:response regulator n=1 Tax=Roseivirga pacifica TaxID=1267423 RepID=UPI002094EC48|nr:response regulator transcription factor [Roseivirga pacifica]MCO6360870.1 response regulator [Roseivirga pacifica]MCO6368759.1 response regulator [Roseivirga pacifica]MCO6372902.1 response regulator [Roseivirga pacifica]MCO6376961.1 response regulator [Roseivirga pacifica]MCO6377761.1 response regulator [Roseivirga pacifica]